MRDAMTRTSSLLLILCLGLPLVLADDPVPVTHRFRFDGRTSDFAQQYYHRFQAGAWAPPLRFAEKALPDEVRNDLSDVGLFWRDLPGLLQRALLWDLGYVMTLSSVDGKNETQFVMLRTLHGRPMANIHVPLKAYERTGCVPQVCSLPTGELSYRSRFCDGDQMERVAMCASEDVDQAYHSTMWAEGAQETFIPELNMNRHYWTEYANSAQYLIYAIHTSATDAPWNLCPTIPTPVIPCVAYNLASNKTRWQRPARGKIVIPWLRNYAKQQRKASVWISVGSVMVAGVAFAAAGWIVVKFRLNRKARLGMKEALLQSGDFGCTMPIDPGEDTQDALDAAARKHFESMIGLVSPAAREDSFATCDYVESPVMWNRRSTTVGASRLSTLCPTPVAVHGLQSFTTTTPSACSFRLFESHRAIRSKRVSIQELQFRAVLNHGSNGEVWLASLRGQDVAVKQLLPNKRRVLKEMEMFMAEIFLVAQLHHPNIVPFVGVAWSTLEQLLMVQEYMAGGDLQTFLRKMRRATATGDISDDNFTWQGQKLAIAQAVASALSYLHNFTPQIVHRDIKSKNVLLSDAMEVKVCDFGICRRKREDDEGATNLTVTEAAGTMSWTAPEVLMSDDYDEKIDIYSYGVLLCEIDTCLLPYHDPEGLATRLVYHPLRLMKHIAQGLRPKLSPTCPPKIATLIEACWGGDPHARPTAAEIVRLLSADDIV